MTLYAKPTVTPAYVTVYCTHQQHFESKVDPYNISYNSRKDLYALRLVVLYFFHNKMLGLL